MSRVSLRKRRWSVEEPIYSCDRSPTIISKPERLQRHASAYDKHGNRGAVLDRYARKSISLDRTTLTRCICHVGAWVALLPEEVASEKKGASNKSPITLLSQLLRMRGRAKLSPWLCVVLQLVAEKLNRYKESGFKPGRIPEDVVQAQWFELQRCMPRKFVLAESSHQDVVLDTSSLARKRLRLFNNEVLLWRNSEAIHKCDRIHLLQEKFEKVVGYSSIDPLELRSLLRQVTATLAPPCVLSTQITNLSVTETDKGGLRESAAIQKIARRILVRAITAWRERLWAEDEQIQPMLDFIKELILRFEGTYGPIENCARAGKQWGLLKAAVISQELPTFATVNSKSVERVTHTERSSLNGNTYTPNSRVSKLRCVVHRPNEPTSLQCPECLYVTNSSWYFVHPISLICVVLKPSHGHQECLTRLGKRVQFEPLGGMRSIGDRFNVLDYCEHNILRGGCFTCGSPAVCTHGKRKQNCRECRKLVKFHRKPGSRAPRLQGLNVGV